MNEKKLSEYVDTHAVNEVLGSFIQQPHLMREYIVVKGDFPDTFHKLVFAAIFNLFKGGAESIDAVAIDEYLSHYETQYNLFTKNKGIDYITTIAQLGQPVNIKYYYERLKKFTVLRSYVSSGQSVEFFFNPNEIDPKTIESQRKNLESHSILEIISYYRTQQLAISHEYVLSKNRDSKKAGVGGLEQLEKWKHSTAWGVGYSSAYLTTILHGLRRGRFTVKSAGTGVGKTRTAMADLGYACAPAFYNKGTAQWEKNPSGSFNGGLYIGTEMELLEEIDPILWALMADVPQEHIEFATYEDNEEERVKEAIRILADESNIWYEYLPSYDSTQIEEVIEEHKIEHNIVHVFFDYIHTTVELISEFAIQSKTRMTVREDQVLANLSNKLKGLCRRYDISLDTSTQVSGDFKNEKNRDTTIVRGSKAIIDKADSALIAMPPTAVELKKIEPIMRKQLGDSGKVPNLVYTVYKNRGGKWNKVKIWLYIDYGTMRTYDLFVTDEQHCLQDIERTYVNIDESTVATNDKQTGKTYRQQKNTNPEDDVF